jgi:hypothetical protein
MPELISGVKSGLKLWALKATSMENLRTLRVGWALTTVLGIPGQGEQHSGVKPNGVPG